MLGLMVSDPMRTETIVLLLDHERRGIGVMVVSGTIPLDSIFDVLDVITSIDSTNWAVSSSHRSAAGSGVDDLDERDVDRWLECSSMLEDAGIELVEWFVIGPTSSAHETSSANRHAGDVELACRPAARAGVVQLDDGPGVAAGVSRRPPARSRRTSSRLSTTSAPSSIKPRRYSSGMS